MVKYKLYEENENTVSYYYYPQGQEEFGSITVNKKTAELVNIEYAKTDKFKRYFFHMIEQIKEFVKSGNFLKEGYVAWY